MLPGKSFLLKNVLFQPEIVLNKDGSNYKRTTFMLLFFFSSNKSFPYKFLDNAQRLINRRKK